MSDNNSDINKTESVTGAKYIFWMDDLSVLYKDGNYINFFPRAGMTRVEQLNALSRFCIYSIILLLLFNRNSSYFYIPLVLLVLIIIFYNVYKLDPKGKSKELFRERFKGINADFINSADAMGGYGHQAETILETGYYDSNGNLVVGGNYDRKKHNIRDIDYSLNEIQQYQSAIARVPSSENPFMNPPITDFNDGFKPVASNVDDDEIKNVIDNKFDSNLYKDIEDLFNTRTNIRMWYTVPDTGIPNDVEAYSNWLYRSKPTCKEDMGECMRNNYEDLRFKR